MKEEEKDDTRYKPFEFSRFLQQLSECSHLKKLSLDLTAYLVGSFDMVTEYYEDDSEEIMVPKVNEYVNQVIFPSLSKFVRETTSLENISIYWNALSVWYEIRDVLLLYEESFNSFIQSMKINQTIKSWKFANFQCYESLDELFQWKPTSLAWLQDALPRTEFRESKVTAPLFGLNNLEKVNKLHVYLKKETLHILGIMDALRSNQSITHFIYIGKIDHR
ncbi:hypothetical protein PPL_08027 [Heterostelium album PN500]|uniref:Uncharacterized protein n=1 Tax=Heterostelium pallidum (strain ATCC 26659 / Pp 5 / PN500) TaxID=670386 RepID=D3BHM3_HETP5|nr:hypothetical protein PPL_08027 [Heterostelium album PN500]EFA79200.1 hypothetical protein PPL_08027 [Heterostelium album PN500]|eukprot:XP_020431321.1 hypothetical protein PPL_08027 [Heterostelium album PN500]